MVELTIVGRVSDGLPLAQGTRYVNEENDNNLSSTYKQQGEFILGEISRGALPLSTIVILINQFHSFSYIIENGICFMTLSDSSYPRKLVFYYLKDLAKEFEKFDEGLIKRITKPYGFVRFGGIIGNIRRQYVDTRTQANLSKLKSGQDIEIMTEDFSQIVKRRNRYEMLQKLAEAPAHASQIWGSKKLEIIALKWTPTTIVFVVAATLIWACLTLRIRDQF
ncbi:hypothetical protein M9H77_29926 [Catharanthus roseus]|uniref:Uncharacterized protein n=1 Tax=Catharanthus roseus TaxID=4058 RepID=A0ACB9ZXS4_CATRO|nr:hypothetical protein M9H77_29926 [Catharanthus roseus]